VLPLTNTSPRGYSSFSSWSGLSSEPLNGGVYPRGLYPGGEATDSFTGLILPDLTSLVKACAEYEVDLTQLDAPVEGARRLPHLFRKNLATLQQGPTWAEIVRPYTPPSSFYQGGV